MVECIMLMIRFHVHGRTAGSPMLLKAAAAVYSSWFLQFIFISFTSYNMTLAAALHGNPVPRPALRPVQYIATIVKAFSLR
jgi:hypothetical protein